MRDALAKEAVAQRHGTKTSRAGRLVEGRKTGTERYTFQTQNLPAELITDRALLIKTTSSSTWHPVTDFEQRGGTVQLSCTANLGDAGITAYLQPDPGRSAQILSAALEKISDKQLGKAAFVLGSGSPRLGSSRDASVLTTAFGRLNSAQQQAVSRALASEITLVWGPPGTGKTEVVARIVEGSVRQGHTVLFVAPTHVATDQALERICELLASQPDFRDGLVRRIGGAQLSSLVSRFGDVIDVGQVLARMAAPLEARIHQLRERQQSLTARLAARSAEEEQIGRVEQARQKAEAAASEHHLQVVQLVRLDDEIKRVTTELASAKKGQLFRKRTVERLQQERASLAAQRITAVQAQTRAEAASSAANQELAALEAQLTGRSADETRTSTRQLRAESQQILAELDDLAAQRRELANDVLQRCRLIAMTAQRSYQGRLPIETPDVVVVDEAGMVDLPTAFHLAARAKHRVVLAGDFRQLPAVVTGHTSRDCTEPDRALIREWIVRDAFSASGVISSSGQVADDSRLIQLDTQFRMRPAICDLVNAVAYPDAPLRTGRNDQTSIPPSPALSAPLVLIDTSNRPAPGRSAYRNDLHAALIREYLRLLQHDGVLPARRAPDADPATRIGIIAPYNEQVRLLNGHVVERLGQRFDGLVDTVHRFQGSQRSIIVVDTVSGSTRQLGVFFEETGLTGTTCRLLNVALSRAQDHLVVVANLAHLRAKLPAASEVRVMLDFLDTHAHRISLDDLVPVRVAADLTTLSSEELARPAFFPADETDEAIHWDVLRARSRVEIYCPFMHISRVRKFQGLLRDTALRGVKITVFTRGEDEEPDHKPIINSLQADGVDVQLREQMHEKIVVVDDVLWHGSLNLLALSRATDLMMRIVSATACDQAKTVVQQARPAYERRGVARGQREYLDVPFSENNELKKIRPGPDGFDRARRQWYVDRSRPDLAAFDRWRREHHD